MWVNPEQRIQVYNAAVPRPVNNQVLIAPNDPVQFLSLISARVNYAGYRVYEHLRSVLLASPEHLERCYEIAEHGPNCGATKDANTILKGSTAFEQMIALETCFANTPKPLQARYTFCFANNRFRMEGSKIPLSVQQNATDMMGVMLGSSRGKSHPAPVYDQDWDRADPWQQAERENFIYHLEALEMVRQPAFIGATLLKGNAFESEYIDQSWRYGTKNSSGVDKPEACVEFKKQKTLTLQQQAMRAQSAAFNLMQLMAPRYFEGKRYTYDDIDLCDHKADSSRPGCYLGWEEQISLKVSPRDIFQAAQAVDGEAALYYQMFRLMIAKIGHQSTPSLQNFIVQRLLETNRYLRV